MTNTNQREVSTSLEKNWASKASKMLGIDRKWPIDYARNRNAPRHSNCFYVWYLAYKRRPRPKQQRPEILFRESVAREIEVTPQTVLVLVKNKSMPTSSIEDAVAWYQEYKRQRSDNRSKVAKMPRGSWVPEMATRLNLKPVSLYRDLNRRSAPRFPNCYFLWRKSRSISGTPDIDEAVKANRVARRKQIDKIRSKIYLSRPEVKKLIRERLKRNRAKITAREKERRRTDLNFRLKSAMKRRMHKVMNGSKGGVKTFEMLGCTADFFKQWIQSQFIRGMHWNNYGSVWHIDHILPCASFDLTDPEQQRKCFHYTNLRPLWAVENMRKGARIIPTQPQLILSWKN